MTHPRHDRRAARGPGVSVRVRRRGVGIRALILAIGCAVSACRPDAGVVLPDELTAAPRSPSGSPWIGLFRGSGSGLVDGGPVQRDDATLVIRVDADSVRRPDCPNCLTVQLDTLFRAVNVEASSEVRLEARDTSLGRDHLLRLDRYSGGGSVGNVVVGTLTVGGSASGSIDFLLERR